MVVQQLGLGIFTARTWVQSLAGELRSCKPHSVTEKKKRRRMNSPVFKTLEILSHRLVRYGVLGARRREEQGREARLVHLTPN